ncbi:probable leucine-rich repeat receptor-like protein kinase At5g49770 isoform X1 [Camellia sinensis]|uniref:probable leucine-rich repeat receptor-like protein kinase At5g49770 isoform X1 n=2 Tax=Camellia sinensis TaxID=4442 RepID=UPI0010362DAD|nr:probable leucine-rich repeat receptor-like protein kinase At5g49770 isoform X1 [Camellia sinensis]
MGSRIQVCLLVISVQILLAAAQNNLDFAALNALKEIWKNTPLSWVGPDPCGNSWEGIRCNNSRVTSITLASMGLTGQLSGDIQGLSELQTLDLSYNNGLTGSLPRSIGNLTKLSNLMLVSCSFSGPIPETIGSLQQLRILTLSSNSFSGPIPPSIGNLFNLYWLDLSVNKLSGTIPVSPGLDMLVNTKHFHCGSNQLSGEIPSQLFKSNMSLIHVLFNNNALSGKIPSMLGLVQTLEILFLSNNQLTGPLPDLTGLNSLSYVDLSNNTFDKSDFPSWFSTLQSLETLMMENTRLQGQIPDAFFSLPLLIKVVLRNNKLNGILVVNSSNNNQLQLIDLQNNYITGYVVGTRFNSELILVGNPVCEGAQGTEPHCIIQQSNSSYSTEPKTCMHVTCKSHQISSPNCRCAHPYTCFLFFGAPSFNVPNSKIYTLLENSLMSSFQSYQLPVDSVSLRKNSDDSPIILRLEVFPYGVESFNRTEISGIAFVLTNMTLYPMKRFGPFFWFPYFAGAKKSSSTGIIVGVAVGCSLLVLLCLLAGIYAFRQKRRAEISEKQNNPFASWHQNESQGGAPQLKGARCFSFEDLKKYTNNFSDANCIGAGGYGKVYRGTLPTEQLVAIKRAKQGSTQGGLEFKSELELLSRIHHKNVVSLVGFCFEQGEQMLVYEYIANGTLKESLSGKSGIRLDWMRRLQIALGAARGLQYLHELANPPIIHGDIKSNNILLDEYLNAKVSDFGLSMSIADPKNFHITTQVKGTMGYLDPEYCMTQQLTVKSDVYGFGVLMIELITAKQPIEKDKYIVSEVWQKMDKTEDLYDLHEILDPNILGTAVKGLEKFVDLAMRCVEEEGAARPTMCEVVKEIENIMQIAPNTDSVSTSVGFEGTSNYPHSKESLIICSRALAR